MRKRTFAPRTPLYPKGGGPQHPPAKPKPGNQLAVATNARLALLGGGAYLSQRLAANTAAPSDLASAANSLANTIQQLGINYLNQAPPIVQDPVRKDLTDELSQLDKLCA